ncbi:hypothetical protein FJ651_05995 [Paucihalobacter ruber]|uniref:Uncharacterized protein n=1 Tax=Paucihalobacter ruber TaxID=2567861 RepID=A0A506PMI4_9FLAO|nr:hypothetical protein [Paucihalobacter ruber]TPV35073.1 hypothetical protein FJ651_05995 [Paucihalobacter ruber]
MKNLILLMFIVSLASCENSEPTINEIDSTSKELLTQLNPFAPSYHPILMALHSDDINYLYDFYNNKLNQYRDEEFFKVGKVQIIGKLIKEKEFLLKTNQNAYQLILNDIFDDQLPSPSLIENVIKIIENDERLSSQVDVKGVLNKNREFIKTMTKNLKKIRKSEYQPNPATETDLRFLGFEEYISKYVDLN